MTDTASNGYLSADEAESLDAEVVERPAELVVYREPPAAPPSIVPQQDELRMLGQMATTLAAASAVPAALRDKPNDVFLVLLSARDLGTSLTVALREFHVIQGRVTLSPKVKLAMVNERGRAEGWAVWPDPDNDTDVATWYATRRDRPGVTFRSTFRWEDGQRAGMVRWDCASTEHCDKCKEQWGRRDSTACKDNWRNYPARMASWRALGYLLDDAFPEIGTGLYSADELGAVTDEDGQPIIDVTEADPLPGHQTPPSRRRKAQSEPSGPPPLLTDEAREALAARITRIQTVPEANEELKRLWTEKDDAGNQRLRPLNMLRAKDEAKAKALVGSIEARLSKGEWGGWPPDGPDSPPSGDSGASERSEPQTAPEAESAPQSEPEPQTELGRALGVR